MNLRCIFCGTVIAEVSERDKKDWICQDCYDKNRELFRDEEDE